MSEPTLETTPSFYERPGVQVENIPIGGGFRIGFEQISRPDLGIGGAYGAWGESIDNQALPDFIAERLGEELPFEARLNLSELGFDRRHHIHDMSPSDHLEAELSVASRFLQAAAAACGWLPEQVQAVLVGMSGPASNDFLVQACNRAGIAADALKVSVHKACDGSMGALNLALNPGLDVFKKLGRNLADELRGKKVLVGGIEGLSRFTRQARDANALQLFGSAAGVIGLVPDESMHFLAGQDFEAFDEEGVLAVRMYYPHSGRRTGQSLVEATEAGESHLRFAGLMNQPQDGSPVVMAGPMGMVKLFVRTGVQVVQQVYNSYRELMQQIGQPERIAVAIVHHANYKINQLKAKHLQREGIHLPMPWLLREFGNVSAASNMIAFLRQLPQLKEGDHILLDGFGAGTYYDVMVVSLGYSPFYEHTATLSHT
jgi:3-oxoacyl-[acyl-carrier-protein] synthase III